MTAEQHSLLAVFAHPDDEILVAGTLAHYRQKGFRVALVCATRGEEGKIAPGVQATRATLGPMREDELRKAARLLGVREVYFLDYRDSGMPGKPSNNNPSNVHNAPLEEVTAKLVKYIRQIRPQIVITFDPTGDYGHLDHIKVHRATMLACRQAHNPSFFPEHMTNGLALHLPSKVYWAGFTREFITDFAAWQAASGMPDEGKFPSSRGFSAQQISAKMAVGQYLELKEQVRRTYASQQNPTSPYTAVTGNLFDRHFSFENYVLAQSQVEKHTGVEDDLFIGLSENPST